MLYERLIKENKAVWEKYTHHSFASQIASGDLKLEKFKYYLGQDYLYLKAYRSCFKHMAINANTKSERAYFEKNTIGDIESDMALMFDVDISKVELSSVTSDYTNYLYKILIEGSNLEKLVAIAPCVIGYGVLAKTIRKNEIADDNYYKQWIEIYASDAYQTEVDEYICLLDEYQVTDVQFDNLSNLFNKVCELEIAFFDQAVVQKKPIVMTIAGSDSGGGAGIQADIKAISANDCYATSCITAITAQTTTGVYGIEGLSTEIISKQIEVVNNDMELGAIKIGMIGETAVIDTVVNSLPTNVPIVLDPVMVAKDNTKLLKSEAITTLVTKLCPKATVITPNIEEANVILNRNIESVEDMRCACVDLAALCQTNVLLKGGHLAGEELVDILYYENKFFEYKNKRIETDNTHGTGCSLSSSLAANIARGYPLEVATEKAIEYVQMGIIQNFITGKGKGPINHFHRNIKIGR